MIAALQKLLPAFPPSYRVLTILPDRGERYLDLVYDDTWTAQLPHVEDVPMLELHKVALSSGVDLE